MAPEITYAKVGGPPDNWRGLKITDLDTGEAVIDVLEVDTVKGICTVYQRNEDGDFLLLDDELMTTERRGRFKIWLAHVH